MKNKLAGPAAARPLLLVFVSLLIAGCASDTASVDSAEARSGFDLVIRHATLVSPEREAPLENAWIAIAGGRIASIGRETEGAPEAERVLDANGGFVTPGLIDAHVHLASVPGIPLPPPAPLEPLVEVYQRQLPKSYLYFGFTTLIDLNVVDPEPIRRMRGANLAPDVYDCGGALALANGYPMAFLPPAVAFDLYPNFLWDPRQAERIPRRFRPEDHAPATAVERVAAGGAICVKVFAEDGFGPVKRWPTPTAEMVREIVAAGHRHGLTVSLHANSYEFHRFATETGADVVVHGMWNWDGLAVPEGGGLPQEIRQVLDQEIAQKIGVMPTARVMSGLQAMFDPAFLDDPQLTAVLPAALIDWYRSADGKWFREELRNDFGGAPDERVRAALGGGIAQGAAVIDHLARHGGRLLFGSDTPSSPTYGNPPGYNGFLEMRELTRAGMTPAQIFRAATLENARAFHLEDRLGTVEPGKTAHLLVLRQNPLNSVEAYDSLATVIVRGRPVKRSQLAANGPSGE
ncbi:MAG: amidohydrolase family protein [Acidobacteriota bacterium]